MLGGRARLEASRSSQFVSALLLTLPVCPRDSVVQLSGPIVSAPYIAATRAVMARHGISLPPGDRTLRIRGRQVYRGGQFQVPGDASSAAYLWAAAAVSGGDVRVEGVPTSWPQADLAILPLLARNGAEVVRTSRGARVRAGPRRAFTVDLTDAPDLYPLAGVLAATTPGASRLRGAAHVVLKESDRRAGTARLARALGARVQFRAGGLDIRGTAQPRSFAVGDLDDHRLVMSAAVGALAADGVSTIGDAHAVAKSFPAFWTVLGSLTGRRGGP
jgi:3-phosphoshikimate 1-carboxyvinyltransferase